MNRNEEYKTLMQELEENTPDLTSSLRKARRKKARKQFLLQPLGSLAAVFALFVLLVNLSTPLAEACSRIPGLRELAKAVTFSPSLSNAVDNAYVQPIELSQSKNGIDVQVKYLIVDQKQVNVFYSLHAKAHTSLFISPNALDANGAHLPCSILVGERDRELRHVCLDFADRDVPDTLQLQMKVFCGDELISEDAATEASGYLAEFCFSLEFDPKFTAPGRDFPIHRTVTLDGQKITVTNVEVYPTHLRVNIQEDPENTAYLRQLHFVLKTDSGKIFEPVANGITATGTTDSPSMTSYRADSSYFYHAQDLELVITGAQWLQKDMEKIPLELKTGEIGPLPQGISLVSCLPVKDGWDVTFRAPPGENRLLYQLFFTEYCDPEGSVYQMDSYKAWYKDTETGAQMHVTLLIRNCTSERIFLRPTFSHSWKAPNEIILPVF